MNIHNMIDAFVLGQLLADDLPIMALKAIQKGYDSPALYELADYKGGDTEHIRRLFFKAIDELEITCPSKEIAALSLARNIANEVIEQKITPYTGAKRIWDEIYTRFPRLEQLRPFVGLASEYEDDESHRDNYNQMIIDECKSLRTCLKSC